MKVYKITMKIELDYSEVIEYSGKDLAMAATLIANAQSACVEGAALLEEVEV